jgi:hypothetical protein
MPLGAGFFIVTATMPCRNGIQIHLQGTLLKKRLYVLEARISVNFGNWDLVYILYKPICQIYAIA